MLRESARGESEKDIAGRHRIEHHFRGNPGGSTLVQKSLHLNHHTVARRVGHVQPDQALGIVHPARPFSPRLMYRAAAVELSQAGAASAQVQQYNGLAVDGQSFRELSGAWGRSWLVQL